MWGHEKWFIGFAYAGRIVSKKRFFLTKPQTATKRHSQPERGCSLVCLKFFVIDSARISISAHTRNETTLWFAREKKSSTAKRRKLNSHENDTKSGFVVLSISQVWFQNKRSKERRLKQLTSMGRGPFFGGSRKMRGFPMNLSPGGLEEPGFPYFASDKFDFGYGGPPFHPHDSPFFPGHPGMPFNAPGRQLSELT